MTTAHLYFAGDRPVFGPGGLLDSPKRGKRELTPYEGEWYWWDHDEGDMGLPIDAEDAANAYRCAVEDWLMEQRRCITIMRTTDPDDFTIYDHDGEFIADGATIHEALAAAVRALAPAKENP